MFSKKIVINAANNITYSKACDIASEYFKINETEKEHGYWLGVLVDRYVKCTGKHPDKIQLDGYWPKYWISVRETKTSVVVEINNAE